jgi:hypothetical protein
VNATLNPLMVSTQLTAAGRGSIAGPYDGPARTQPSPDRSTVNVNLTHGLRTPLNHIIGYGELMPEEVAQVRRCGVRARDAKTPLRESGAGDPSIMPARLTSLHWLVVSTSTLRMREASAFPRPTPGALD